MNASTTSVANDTLRIQPGADVIAGIEWFTLTGAESPAGSSATVDDMSTRMTDMVPDATWVQHPDVARAVAFVRDALRAQDRFIAAAVLAGQRGELVVYSQWRTSGAQAPAFPDAWSIAQALPALQRFEARVLEAGFSGPDAVSVMDMAVTPNAHFGYFTVAAENQARLIELARDNAPESFGVPGLKAVNFHRSLDGKRVVNLGLWSTLEDMKKLTLRPGFKPGAKYWLEIAGFRPHFFQIAAVVAA